ncbi:helix-turn-helix domain-containing protein, partial [Actinosynnema sp. NPDC059797]
MSVPRPEKPLKADDDPVTALARGLRALRREAGNPTYRELSTRSHYSVSTLADAAAGKKLPSLAVTVAFARGCGADPGEWERRWRAATAETTAFKPERVDGERAPYPGPAAFRPQDAALFSGREELAEHLVRRVHRDRFVAVFGASGAGKSSLLRAGLIARSEDRPVLSMTPGCAPLEECAVALSALTGCPVAELHAELRADPENLHLRIRQVTAGSSADVLVVVDQFEELFTLCDDVEREAFLGALLHAARSPSSAARVVLGVRTDFRTRCAEHPALAEAMRDAEVLVGPMTTDELRAAITGPAEVCGYRLEGALVATVLAETGGHPGVLPLLSHALLETWRRRRGTTMTLAAYRETGGIAEAVARTADRTYEALDDAKRRIARDLFLRMVAADEREDAKRVVHRDELDTGRDTALVVERLIGARLVTADARGLEMTHEVLIRSWPRLRNWLDAGREGLGVHRRLGQAATSWDALGRDPGSLYRGVRLATAHDWVTNSGTHLNAVESAFLAASLAAGGAGSGGRPPPPPPPPPPDPRAPRPRHGVPPPIPHA